MNASGTQTNERLQLLTKYLNIKNIWFQSLVYILLLFILYPIEKIAIPYIVSTCIVKWHKGDAPSVLSKACVNFIILFLVMTFIWGVLYYLGLNVQQHIGVDVREAIVKELFQQYQTEQKTVALGAMTTHLNNVPTILEQLFYKTVCYILPESVGLFVVACYFTYVNVWLGVGSLVFLIICTAYFVLFIHRSQQLAKNEYKQQTQFHQNAHNIVDNLAYIQTSQSDEYELSRFEKQCDSFYTTRSRFCIQNSSFIAGFHVLKILFMMFVVYVMYVSMVDKQASVRHIVLYGSVFVILISEEKDIDYVFKLITELYNFISRASVMLDEQRTGSSSASVTNHNVPSSKPDLHHMTASQHMASSDVALSTESLAFRHPQSSQPIFQHKKVHFPVHQLHAIVGPSGSGKTTFAKLIAGIHNEPTSGQIYLHGNNYTHDAQTRRSMVMYLPQHIKLFEGSILDNIRYTHETMNHASVHNILESFGVADILKGKYKPSTYLHRQVGIDGGNISGGQKQIIILMRTYIDTVIMVNSEQTTRKSILVLDEPTASLDDRMVGVVMKILQTFKRTHTIIMITHNLHIAKQCDSVTLF